MPDAPGEVIPLVVLSSHRSGSSAFMSLLAAAGLELGELLPPAPDNPRGFFESRPFVDANRRLLGDADRDWTCPPGIINHRLLDLEALGKAIEPTLWAAARRKELR